MLQQQTLNQSKILISIHTTQKSLISNFFRFERFMIKPPIGNQIDWEEISRENNGNEHDKTERKTPIYYFFMLP